MQQDSKFKVVVKVIKTKKMPVNTNYKANLALKLRQNWNARYPMDTGFNTQLDDSLTSLNWLHNLNIMKITSPTIPDAPEPVLTLGTIRDTRVNPNSVLNITIPKIEQRTMFGDMMTGTVGNEKVDYKTNPYVKPPYSYATLICMAMKETKKTKITLSSIYNWIMENFMYYRVADPSWQNSIRHNLSLNKCFQKVPRRKDEPGKGGFWRINPEYSDMFVNGIFKKRRASTRENLPPCGPAKRIKLEPESDNDDDDSCSSLTDNDPMFTRIQEATPAKTVKISDPTLTGNDDFTWNSLLNQDIDVGGIKMKTEQILNEVADDSQIVNPLLATTPSSDSNSNTSFEDLLGEFSAEMSNETMPLDLTSGTPLDLTVSGTGITKPDWWNESGNTANLSLLQQINRNGLHTPVPESDLLNRSWNSRLEDATAAFDLDSLFDISSFD